MNHTATTVSPQRTSSARTAAITASESDPYAFLADTLRQITVRGWRLRLDPQGHRPAVAQLRGTWGSALRAIDEADYEAVFGDGPRRRPRYLFREAVPMDEPAEHVPGGEWEFLLIGPVSEATQSHLWQAFERAGCQGLGRDRIPFFLDEVRPLAWDGSPLRPTRMHPGFALSPLPADLQPDQPCRFHLTTPVRLHFQGREIREPSLTDLTVAALRRIEQFLEEENHRDRLRGTRDFWLQTARNCPVGPFVGRPAEFSRYSASQQKRIRLSGVVGHRDLPRGAGPLLPLWTAARWLHLGKGTVFGLGGFHLTLRNNT